jgi:hypothetical protein
MDGLWMIIIYLMLPSSETKPTSLRKESYQLADQVGWLRHRLPSVHARDSAEMATAAQLGSPSLHAQTSKLGSLDGLRARQGCALQRNAVNSVNAGVGSRRWVGVRAANADTIRAAKKGSPPMMPAVLTPSGAVDLGTLMLRNRIIFVGSPVNSEVNELMISKLKVGISF